MMNLKYYIYDLINLKLKEKVVCDVENKMCF